MVAGHDRQLSDAWDAGVSFSRPSDTVDPNYQNEWFGLAAVSQIDAISNPSGTNRALRKSYAALQTFWNPERGGVTGTGAAELLQRHRAQLSQSVSAGAGCHEICGARQ